MNVLNARIKDIQTMLDNAFVKANKDIQDKWRKMEEEFHGSSIVDLFWEDDLIMQAVEEVLIKSR